MLRARPLLTRRPGLNSFSRDLTMTASSEVAVVGAGPYGLSLATHLKAAGIDFRIFGNPMQVWRERMPEGVTIESDGFASNLSEPAAALTLNRHLDTFVHYDIDTYH